jgi:hypothetical protein
LAKEDAIARWMLGEIEKEGQLFRDEATAEIARRFGYEFVYVTEPGGLALDRKVLKAFEKLTKTKVVFVKEPGYPTYWRMRRPDDKPGRRQEG